MDEREYYENRERQLINEKIEREKNRRRREIQVKGLRGFIMTSALLIAGLGIYNIKTCDDEHLSYNEVMDEMYIHSGHAEDPKGNMVNPYLDHNCEFPYDGKTKFTDRLSDAMAEEYDPEVIEETIALFEPMAYGTNEDFEEAKERLEEIKVTLIKGEDGKYRMKEKTKTY